jgi:hypothetical protein
MRWDEPQYGSGPPVLVVKPARWTTVAGAVGCLLAVLWFVGALTDSSSYFMLESMSALGLFGYMLARSLRSSTEADSSGLTLRGPRVARRLAWREIRTFTLENPDWLDASRKSLVAHLWSGESVTVTGTFGHTTREMRTVAATLESYLTRYGAPLRPDRSP